MNPGDVGILIGEGGIAAGLLLMAVVSTRPASNGPAYRVFLTLICFLAIVVAGMEALDHDSPRSVFMVFLLGVGVGTNLMAMSKRKEQQT